MASSKTDLPKFEAHQRESPHLPKKIVQMKNHNLHMFKRIGRKVKMAANRTL